MILINVKFHVKSEYKDTFLDQVQWYTDACNAEPGCIFFKWYADPEDDSRFLLIEAYEDGADVAHVESDHFKRGCEEMPQYLVETPDIINTKIPGKTTWDKMAEYKVD
ncbi:antibiotic biosynthesis monooxygenase [Corynebacterium lizhenjunii]|uniref:Antibiotic biosynthesis monooxygenase n=1 Tax=Corynebacterium lizhenjunii TaxID=2709394 RepID=A0A7T0KFV5_9CORY|nr:putative quinol monooxygenase [Corynebacterium lizhenjunii]QPK79822.1 antibiotic biosynthesis monooxygenase [Corynebacterium lizhenjunii]